MATVILDRELAEDLIAKRRELGQDKFDEVWDGVYMMAAAPNDEHAFIVMRLTNFLDDKLGFTGIAHVRSNVNVSDRVIDWRQNFRVPDVAVMLTSGASVNHGSFWLGGPDFVVEVCSPDEDSHEKIPFYESIGVRELLIIDRDPWKLEFFQLSSGKLSLVKEIAINAGEIESGVIPFRFGLVKGNARPELSVSHTLTGDMRKM